MIITVGHPFAIEELGLPSEAKDLIMLWVPPGSFTMGENPDAPGYEPEDGPAFTATLSAGFWLGQFAVTQAQWIAIMHTNPSQFQENGLNHPVENISWFDALAFCNKLNERFTNQLPEGYQFSLPTEMQWEYACCSGTTDLSSTCTTETDFADITWYAANSEAQTHPVGKKAANSWGFYDMHGNVSEWCYDAAEDYPPANPADWIGTKNEFCRSLRGSGFGITWESRMGCASRVCSPPNTKRSWFGFRLCLRIIT